MSRAGSPATFSPRAVLGIVLFGALTFIGMLYFLATGQTGGNDQNGGAHAVGNGLVGFAAFRQVLQADGHSVELARNEAGLRSSQLVVITPQQGVDGDELVGAIDRRRYLGPTMLILPKWQVQQISPLTDADTKPGWVEILWPSEPRFVDELETELGITLTMPNQPESEEVQAALNAIDEEVERAMDAASPDRRAPARPDASDQPMPAEQAQDDDASTSDNPPPMIVRRPNRALDAEDDDAEKPEPVPWSGLGVTGEAPEWQAVLSIVELGQFDPLVSTQNGSVIAAASDSAEFDNPVVLDTTDAPVELLEEQNGSQIEGYPEDFEVNEYDPGGSDGGGYDASDYGDSEYGEDEYYEEEVAYPLIIVSDPDLLNNYGMAKRESAQLALALVDYAYDGEDSGVVFDLTFAGLGKSENLLTLAFRPPFLAATICLIVALLIVGWRAFKRFGPPASSGPDLAFGKSALVANSAGFLQRTGRLHLLSAPIARAMENRFAKQLGLRRPNDETIEAAIRARLTDPPSYTNLINSMRNATTAADIVRAARALTSLERNLSR